MLEPIRPQSEFVSELGKTYVPVQDRQTFDERFNVAAGAITPRPFCVHVRAK